MSEFWPDFSKHSEKVSEVFSYIQLKFRPQFSQNSAKFLFMRDVSSSGAILISLYYDTETGLNNSKFGLKVNTLPITFRHFY